MNRGIVQLRHEAQRIDEALRAFDAPIASELSGLRLMRQVLAERHTQVLDKLRDAERCKIVVGINHQGRPEDGVPASVVAGITAAVQRAVRALAHECAKGWNPAPGRAVIDGEVELYVLAWTSGSPAQITLQFPRGPEEQLLDPATQTSLLEQVLEAFAAALANGPSADAVAALAQLVVDHALTLEVSTELTGGASQQASLDRPSAQEILHA